MEKSLNDDIFHQAVRYASQRPSFVAAALSEYCSIKQIEEKQLADYLGCQRQDLPKLALCRRPNTETSSSFRKDVERIASYAGVDRNRLAKLFREVESHRASISAPQQSNPTPTQGILMAASDRTFEEVPEKKNYSKTVETES